MRRGVAAIALLALLMGSAAQSAQPIHPNPVDSRSWPDLKKALADMASASYGGGGLTQALAMLGREDLAALIPLRPFDTHPACSPLLEGGKPVDPVSYIAARAAQTRVTMINEAHDLPQTRAFIMKVAAALRAKGYEGYAAETFATQIGVEDPAWPRISDGWYSREAVYGRLIRQLRREGFHLLSYEFVPLQDPKIPFLDQAMQRESGEAANLIVQANREGEDKKILVHVGYAHLNKNAPKDGAPALMGYHFARISGVDPLTVDQTVFSSPNADYVVCDQAHAEPQARVYTDITIGMPKLQFERGRPSYRLALGDRFAEIPAKLLRRNQIAIYDARPVGEPLDSVPMDRILLRPDEKLPLLLPPGRYTVTVWTEKDGWSGAAPLTVLGRAKAKT